MELPHATAESAWSKVIVTGKDPAQPVDLIGHDGLRPVSTRSPVTFNNADSMAGGYTVPVNLMPL